MLESRAHYPGLCCANWIKHWALWFGHANRIVKQERIGELEVSTVFLGIVP